MNNIITAQSVDYAISMVTDKRTNDLNELDSDCFFVSAKGRPIKAKTVGQKRYITFDAFCKSTELMSKHLGLVRDITNGTYAFNKNKRDDGVR